MQFLQNTNLPPPVLLRMRWNIERGAYDIIDPRRPFPGSLAEAFTNLARALRGMQEKIR